MNLFHTFTILRSRILINRLRTLRQESRLKIVVVSTLAAILWTGLFLSFQEGFTYLEKFFYGLDNYFTSAILSLFFGALLIMLTFSNAIISYSAMYRSRESAFLLSCPVSYDAVFLHKLVESVAFSSWAFLFLGLPMVMAYGRVEGAGLGFYLLVLPFFGAFVLIPAGVGAILAMLLSALVPSSARRTLWILGAVVGVLSIWLGMRLLAATGETATYTYAWMNDLLGKLRFAQNRLIPSYWMTEGLMRSAMGEWREALFQWGVLASNGLMITLVAAWISLLLYPAGWTRVQSRSQNRWYTGQSWLHLRGPQLVLRLLIDKDFTVFRRDPVQWSQCAILLGLLGIYILNIRAFRFHVEGGIWRNWTAFLNLAATSLVLATLTTRFVFPLLSLEGKRFWVLGLLPIPRETILYSKFWFSLATSLAVSEVLIVLSNLMLDTSAGIMALHVVTVGLICVALSGLSVGMSALYPNLKEDNPSKIVSGFGGTLNLILSLLYVAVVVIVEAIPCHLYLTERISLSGLNTMAAGGFVLVVLLTAVTTVVPLALGVKAIRRMEV